MRFVENNRAGPHHSFKSIADSLHSYPASLYPEEWEMVRASLRLGVYLDGTNLNLAGKLNSGSLIAREN